MFLAFTVLYYAYFCYSLSYSYRKYLDFVWINLLDFIELRGLSLFLGEIFLLNVLLDLSLEDNLLEELFLILLCKYIDFLIYIFLNKLFCY